MFNERKIKELENTINDLKNQLKISKNEIQKQKSQNLKLQQDIEKLNKKIEKYQNAIFEKAMEKNLNVNNINSLGNSQISQNNATTNNQLQKSNITYNEIPLQKPKIQFKIDTYTQHRPSIISPITSNNRSISPYHHRQVQYPTTPTRQYERSVSPLNKRVSFNHPQTIPSLNQNQNLQVSAVRRVQIGDPITIKPISPVVKLQSLPNQINLQRSANKIMNINQLQNGLGLGKQFYSSRITAISPLRR